MTDSTSASDSAYVFEARRLATLYHWQLLPAEAWAVAAQQIAPVPADVQAIRRALYTAYGVVLHAACTAPADAAQREQAYRELYDYFWRKAYFWDAEAACDIAQEAIILIFRSFTEPDLERCTDPATFLDFAHDKLRAARRDRARVRKQVPPLQDDDQRAEGHCADDQGLAHFQLTECAAEERHIRGGGDELMVRRYGQLDFPAQAALGVPYALTVAICQTAKAGVAGQIELGLIAHAWPLKVVVTLVGVRPEDFLVEGPTSGVIEVPRDANSAPFAFTLIPQSLGRKRVRVRFEQNNAYLGTAWLETEIAPAPSADVTPAAVRHAPTLAATGLAPDVTIFIEQRSGLTYAVSIKMVNDDPAQPAVEVDRITFPKPPDAYLQTLFDELNTKTAGNLTPQEFDAGIAKQGNALYESLFHNEYQHLPGFKTFYRDILHPLSKLGARIGYVPAVQIVSDEPYIPWEILRGSLPDVKGRWRADSLAFCERFNLARWLAGPGTAHKLPILNVALVAPPSNLKFVQQEVEALRNLPGLAVKVIENKTALEEFLQNGQAEALHFACHGAFNAELPARSAVKLGDRFLRAAELTPQYRNFALARPLVFMNACDSGQLGVGLTGLDGWAEAFLTGDGGQAGVFIGSVWQTTDALASQFAAVFYARLLAGDRLAKAMRQARAAVKRAGDATYLSYTLYANPKVRAARATAPA